jgi:hypothetical protein
MARRGCEWFPAAAVLDDENSTVSKLKEKSTHQCTCLVWLRATTQHKKQKPAGQLWKTQMYIDIKRRGVGEPLGQRKSWARFEDGCRREDFKMMNRKKSTGMLQSQTTHHHRRRVPLPLSPQRHVGRRVCAWLRWLRGQLRDPRRHQPSTSWLLSNSAWA